jgi:phosphohistidine phosphatase SixA
MRVYLVRHAEAAPSEPDELRPLTEAGKRQSRALGERLAAGGLTAVRTSPLLRALQTGEALARAAGVETEPDERLRPGASADDVRAIAEECGGGVAIVGHQPDCGEIAAELGGGPEPSFPPAGVVELDL